MKLIHLFTDFGLDGPYVGELKAVLNRNSDNISCIDLMHDAPRFNSKLSAYLLAAIARQFVKGDCCLAIVDPHVGSQDQRPLLIVADGVVYCGPDNGLFSLVIQQAKDIICYEIIDLPDSVSISFHGRDIFAHALIKYLDQNTTAFQEIEVMSLVNITMPSDLDEIVYFDSYGNAITGRRDDTVATNNCLVVNESKIKSAKTFSAVEKNELFWYTNSMGLVEIASNQANAKMQLRLEIGQLIRFVS